MSSPSDEIKDDKSFDSNTWERPVAMEKDRHTRSWLILLSVACFIIALWTPLNRLYWRARNSAVSSTDDAPRHAERFLALSYEGVSDEATDRMMSASAFRSHLAALKEAGYRTITLEDVRAFYEDERPLPDKSVLITFETGFKSTYFSIRDALAKNRMHAVMGVVTGPMRDDNSDVLLRPYLKDLALDATWDLACESDRGDTYIPASPSGRTAAFFSSPEWIAASNRYERFEEFSARIGEDHDRAISELTGILDGPPIAFFFPFGNYGQFDEGARGVREANLAAVAARYKLGFIRNRHALNDRGTDRRRLNRLAVPVSWSAEELIENLENAWPKEAEREHAESKIPAARWISDWGTAEPLGDDGMLLRADAAADPNVSDDGATGGARAWISGSSGFRDGTFDILAGFVCGEFSAYLRFAADDDWVRFSISETGRASVSACVPGEDSRVLSEYSVKSDSEYRSVHSIQLTLRDDLIFARLDGEPLFGGPVVLPAGVGSAAGLVGLGVWSSGQGLARLEVYDAYLRSRTDAVVTWPPALASDPGRLAEELRRSAFRYTIVSPPWLDVYAASPVSFPTIDSSTLDLLAAASHAKVFPELALHDADSISSIDPDEVVERLLKSSAHGLYLDASEYPVEKIPALKAWLARLLPGLRTLAGESREKLAIRFPLAMRKLASVGNFVASMPEVLVVDEEAAVPPGVSPSRVLGRITLRPKASDEDLTLFYQLADFAVRAEDTLSEKASWRSLGLRAYGEGKYAEAARCWAQWASNDVASAEAEAFLGNAYSRMRETEKAADAYGRSLMIEPGRIDLVIERVRLLEEAQKSQEAADLLDLYARAFPENTSIAIAQAQWLDKHDRRPEGREILRSIVERDPTDIRARLALQSLLDEPADRYANMHELLNLGARGETQRLGFGHDIDSAELLTIPEASVFFDFVRDCAKNSPQEKVRELYDDFLPLKDPISESFDIHRLSDSWIALGTPLAAIAGAYDLQAASDMSEAYLRLKKSELLRDGFIEVSLGESVGAFWLYARRSSRAMVRFGFDGDGYLRVQTWRDGEIRTSESRAWIRPAGDITLRLEVRGDGAVGIVDGKRVFPTPLPIPADIAYGWWSIAPFSPELGLARARIGRIAAGPLPTGIALMRENDPDVIAKSLDILRDRIENISAVAPVLFTQAPDGGLLYTPTTDIMPFRMFCSYHRLRLMPIVALDYYSDIEPETLVKVIKANRLNAICLLVRSMPHEKWFKMMSEAIEETGADLLVFRADKPLFSDVEQTVDVREIQRGSVLLSPAFDKRTITPERIESDMFLFTLK